MKFLVLNGKNKETDLQIQVSIINDQLLLVNHYINLPKFLFYNNSKVYN
jgi:hypothetical protein